MAMAVEVKLEWHEVLSGAMVGVVRKVECMRLGKRDAYGARYGHKWTVDIEGALGEVAVAKFLGVYWWAGVNVWKGADLLDFVQVRYSQAERPRLIVRSGDSPDDFYVLVVPGARDGEYVILGGIWGRDARKDEFVDAPANRPAAWMVPHERLIPAEAIPGALGLRLGASWERGARGVGLEAGLAKDGKR